MRTKFVKRSYRSEGGFQQEVIIDNLQNSHKVETGQWFSGFLLSANELPLFDGEEIQRSR